MTHTSIRPEASTDPSPPPGRRGGRGALIAALALAAVLAVAAVAGFALTGGDDDDGQSADVGRQGDGDSVLAADAARLVRRDDGVFVEVEIPTPEPGTYEYPLGGMIPPWAAPHPPVGPGASDAPEVFTGWLFVFNYPDRCTEPCDLDDLGADTAALGGSYQFDGRIADGDTLRLAGATRLGEDAANGAPLENPLGAEIHAAIAPHGRVLPGADGWRQLNGPLGNPTLWWAATFLP